MIKIIEVGSVALKRHIGYLAEPIDVDYIMTYPDFKVFLSSLEGVREYFPINKGKTYVVKTSDKIYEVEIAWEGSTAEEFMKMVMTNNITQARLNSKIPSLIYTPTLKALYLLKMSHRYLKDSPHFLKTMGHIKLMRLHMAKSEYDAPLDLFWKNWFKRREQETYWYAHPDLTVKKKDFFKDEVFYKYDHDDIHEAIKIGDIPAYKRIVADGEQVKCDVNKWNDLSYENKLHCALEECYTLALERMLVPNDFKPNVKKAFDIALMKVCSSITSGWFREWCWENYDSIQQSFNPEFAVKFKVALEWNLVRPFSHDR